MGRYNGKACRLLCMLSLTFSFFLVELVVGYITNSLALVGDSYHMLSDVLALGIGFASIRISKWDSHKNTYGWARAEVLGALINTVFLIALCFTIFVEALGRLTHTEEIHDPVMLLIVGGIGLLVNIIGLALFAGHAHSHGGHGHSHGGHGHSHGGSSSDHGHSHGAKRNSTDEREESNHLQDGALENENEANDNSENVIVEEHHIPKSSAQLNMKGVFLHVLGDALGSVIVIISALVLMFVDSYWKYKVDPVLSLVLVLIILSTAFPLFKESALILLQTVPTHIQVSTLQDKLVKEVPGILAVHEFHIWQLAGDRIIASAHITCQNVSDYMRVAEQVKTFFHNAGIHSTTIQPEFIEYVELNEGRDCALECGPDKTCYPNTCCGKKLPRTGSATDAEAAGSEAPPVRQRHNSTLPGAPASSRV